MNGPSVLDDEQRSGRAALSGAGTSTGTVNGTNGKPGRHTGGRAKTKAKRAPGRPRRLSLSNWPVAARLAAVFAVASVTGLVFGGLRASDAINTADDLGRTSQLATLGEQVTGLAQVLENERDVYSGLAAYGVLQSKATGGHAAPSVTGPIMSALQKQKASLTAAEKATDAQAQRTRTLAAAIGPAFPASVQGKAAGVIQAIDSIPGLRTQVAGVSAGQVISSYTNPIDSLFQLDDQITSGSGDATLADDVRALNGISRAKDEASQQRAILFSTLLEITVNDTNTGNDLSGNALPDSGGITTLTTALGLQAADETDFQDAATQEQSDAFAATVGGQPVDEVNTIVGAVALHQDPRVLFEPVGRVQSAGFDKATLATAWYTDSTALISQLRTIESHIAAQTVARTQSLQQQAIDSAILTAAVTAGAVILVLLATALVGRTLVNPLRRLQADALEIATKRLPERVVAAAAGTDAPEASAAVEPIGVQSTDEIGRVARAFDQVHAEAVRLAGTEAQLRGSLNAMFISLSRRSVPLIDRLARMIDSMEQSEDDPDQLADLFAMDHMVTRMRRNSENLLVLAGEEPIRKWTESVPLSDVARAAAAEIEQYNRVALAVQPGIMVSGQAAADVVHLLAELIENATLFSPQSSKVRVTVMELNSGGVLIEVRDDGVGISATRLADMNWRLDHPPVVDVSISRHMGLYAVSRLAARHGIRVKLRPGTPQGLSALVWLPGHLAKNEPVPAGGTRPKPVDLGWGAAELLSTGAKRRAGRHHRNGLLSTSGEQPALTGRSTPAGRPGTIWFTAKRPSGGPVKSPEEIAADWQPAPGARAAARSSGTGPVSAGPPFTGPPAAGVPGGFAAADGASGRATSGLPQRVPGKSAYPATGPDVPGTGIPAAAAAAAAPVLGAPAGSPDAQHHEQAPPRRRSPEVARSRLSGFQLGNRDATQAGQGASWGEHAGEENDR